MPFPDEKSSHGVEVVASQPQWASEGQELAAVLARMLPDARAVDHIGSTHPKRVFAPPVGGRSTNIHVRESGAPTARYSLLFRDFLRSNDDHRDTWGRLKTRLAEEHLDIYAYGQVKAAAQPLLMALAEQWADETGWHA